MTLLDRHLGFLEALRAAGVPVSLVEGLDAISAVSNLSWRDRELVKAGYAATCVKRQAQRTTFDALFDLYFPDRIGGGVATDAVLDEESAVERDSAAALESLRDQLAEAMTEGDRQQLAQLAAEAVARFGAMPGRGPGMSAWSAYTALRRVAPSELIDKLITAFTEAGLTDTEARARAGTRVGEFTALVEADALRRVAEDKGPERMAEVGVKPTIDRIDLLSASKKDLEELRREIQPMARRLATRLTQEHHARRRGPLDFRRTVRASMATGGVPLTTHHRPKRPHRTELVVLCDVSGSVANFAQFTLMLLAALREQFTSMRAFTFIDHVTEVTDRFDPHADPAEVMANLAASAAHAALWGRTNYGRAFSTFNERYADSLGPKSSLLIVGDARSNYSDPGTATLREMVEKTRNAWWLNPEHRRNWNTGDSAAGVYGEIVEMVECRNLTQLGEFVHDIV